MFESLIETDPRFWVLSEALASYMSDGADPSMHAGDRLQAAVSIVIRATDDLDFLLIKRAQSERDPWSGHMALPGGRRDASDGDLMQTACRETAEETGVDLETLGTPLGHLVDVAPSSPRLPKLTISSYVFGVPASTDAEVASTEIEAVHWIGLDELRAPSTRASIEISLPGGPRTFPSFALVGEHVWGLTYNILIHFLNAYPDSELDKLRG